MWNCKFGAKSGGYLRSDPLRCLLITGYQANINQISKMPQASKWLCGISVYFYLFLSVSIYSTPLADAFDSVGRYIRLR